MENNKSSKTYILIKVFIISISFSLCSYLLVEYFEFSRHRIQQDHSQKVLDYLLDLQEKNEKPLTLNKYLDESIDTFYIIGPYLTSDLNHKIVGQKWYNYETFSDYLFSEVLFSGENFDEDYQQLIFTEKSRIISFAKIKRNHGDFLSLEKNKYKVKEAFKSIKEYDQYFRIKKANE